MTWSSTDHELAERDVRRDGPGPAMINGNDTDQRDEIGADLIEMSNRRARCGSGGEGKLSISGVRSKDELGKSGVFPKTQDLQNHKAKITQRQGSSFQEFEKTRNAAPTVNFSHPAPPGSNPIVVPSMRSRGRPRVVRPGIEVVRALGQ